MHRILVVEDNALNSELLKDWLEMEGYTAQCVQDLSNAYRSLEQELPDAILLDVQLGNEDGLTLSSWVRKQQRLCEIPVIAVTAHAMVNEHQRFLHAGCNACVSKPINFKLLREELNRWLDPRLKTLSTR
jgi:CheY-like chemotaxis protein